jgi:hypothetical protein
MLATQDNICQNNGYLKRVLDVDSDQNMFYTISKSAEQNTKITEVSLFLHRSERQSSHKLCLPPTAETVRCPLELEP